MSPDHTSAPNINNKAPNIYKFTAILTILGDTELVVSKNQPPH